MRKLSRPPIEDPAPDTSRRKLIVAVALGMAIAPLVYEGAALCVARWAPVLDAIGRGVEPVLKSVQRSTSRTFKNVPWRPTMVIPVACAWAFCGSFLLRRKHC